jgi:hypothetical protein
MDAEYREQQHGRLISGNSVWTEIRSLEGVERNNIKRCIHKHDDMQDEMRRDLCVVMRSEFDLLFELLYVIRSAVLVKRKFHRFPDGNRSWADRCLYKVNYQSVWNLRFSRR